MKRVLAIGFIFLAGAVNALAGSDRRDQAAFWVKTYGILDAGSEPLVTRAQAIFQRVMAAADKSASRPPSLLLVDRHGAPFAAALPDGTIVVSRAGLRLCYERGGLADGDARLAFVLGHELAHLARDDFWHTFAAEGPAGSIRRETAAQSHEREGRADAYGAVYLTMAGYSPGAIVDGQFLDDWSRHVGQETAAATSRHPSASARARMVRRKLMLVRQELDLFHFGTRLYQLGRYDDALALLERFRGLFPSREVLGNIGLCHYRLAERLLAGCDAAAVTRFRMPLTLDLETLAQRIPMRQGPGASCLAAPSFADRSQRAVTALEEAARLDPTHVSVRIHLAAAHILRGEHAEAAAASEKALRHSPKDARALVTLAAALYLSGLKSAGEDSLRLLAEARGLDPREPAATFARARILHESGQTSEARSSWVEYLELEPRGPHAEEVRRHLDLPAVVSAPSPRIVEPPLPLGRLSAETTRQLRTWPQRAYDGESARFVVYSRDGLRALRIDRSIAIAERDVPGDGAAASSCADPAPRQFDDPPRRTLVFPGLACDFVDGRVTRQSFFAE